MGSDSRIWRYTARAISSREGLEKSSESVCWPSRTSSGWDDEAGAAPGACPAQGWVKLQPEVSPISNPLPKIPGWAGINWPRTAPPGWAALWMSM